MKEKVLKIILISILIMTLTITDFVVIGKSMVIALAEDSTNMLDVTTNIKNVQFNAYLEDSNTATYSKQSIISEGEHLILMIAVKEAGALENGKIKIENSNFRLQEAESKYIKNINIDANEIELNGIITGNVVEINVPIVFDKSNEISKEYISKETKVTFTGDYKNDKDASKKVTSERIVTVSWRENTEIAISQDLDKYIYLEDDLTLIQQKVNSEIVNNTLVNGKVLEVTVPEIEDVFPEHIDVLVNGSKIQEDKFVFDKQNNVITVQNMNNSVPNDEYKIIYYYPKKFQEESLSVSLNSKITALLYSDEVVEKHDVKDSIIEQSDNRVSVNVDASKSVFKGFLFANSYKNTPFHESFSTEISSLHGISSFQFHNFNSSFADQSGITSSVNDLAFINSIKFSKSNLESIFGADFSISIFSNDQLLSLINIHSDWNDNGELFISLDQHSLASLSIVCSQPINIGTLHLDFEKYITGQTSFNKEQLKSFNSLINYSSLSFGDYLLPITSSVSLQDTCTEARLEISNNNLSVLHPNENVQILAILKSDSEKYDLYKNPSVQIKLPDELQHIDVHSVNILYSDGLSVSKSIYDINTKTIQIQLDGEQLDFRSSLEEGIQIVINADLTFKMNLPDMHSAFTLLFTNQNASEAQYQTTVDVSLNSRYGSILYTNVSGFNNDNTVLESADSDILHAQLDMDGEQKHSTVTHSFINNYDSPINQITVVGNLADSTCNFDAPLLQNVITDSDYAQIFYSNKDNATPDDDSWQEAIENLQEVKSYKIVLNKELQPLESFNLSYQLVFPSLLGAGAKNINSTNVSYSLNGQLMEVSSGIEFFTQGIKATGIGIASENAGIKTEIVALSANKELVDGEEIFEGQPIKYTVKVTNNTGKDLNHLNFVAEHTNAVYYVQIEKEAEVTDNPDNPEIMIFTKKDETAKNVTKSLDILKNGETTTFTYEFSPKKKDGVDIVGSIKIKADEIEEKAISTITNRIKDSQIALEVLNDLDETVNLHEEDIVPFTFNISNNTDEEQKDIVVNIQTSDELSRVDSVEELEEALSSFFEDGSKVNITSYSKNEIVFKLPKLKSRQTLSVNIVYRCDSLPNDKQNYDANIYYTAKLGDNTYCSNMLIREFSRSEARITGSQSSNVEGEKVKIGDRIVYTADIINNDPILNADNLKITQDVTEGNAKVEKAYLKRENGEIIDATIKGTNKSDIEYSLKAGEKIQYIVEVLLWNNPDENVNYEDVVKNYVHLSWGSIETLSLNLIEHEIELESNKDDYNDNDYDDDNNNDNNYGYNSTTLFSISGVAWLDNNKDGAKDEGEDILSNLDVRLLDNNTGEVIKSTKTDENGIYKFETLEKGDYIVIFEYDSLLYSITQYQKEGVKETKNSDFVQKEKDGKIVAISDVLTIKNRSISNIDAGFIRNKKFDLSLDKSISKVIVKNKAGIDEKVYNKSKLAKVEIGAKYIEGSMVVIEYEIEVKNEGEIAGYAKDIIDYMPEDLDFSSELNKDWSIGVDGSVHSTGLSNQVIKPGESRKLTLVLTKKMTGENTGRSVNIAEIANATNDLSILDEDSTPGNRNDDEDDISRAELIISIKTGALYIAIGIIITVLGLTIFAFVIYKKRKGGK